MGTSKIGWKKHNAGKIIGLTYDFFFSEIECLYNNYLAGLFLSYELLAMAPIFDCVEYFSLDGLHI